MIIYRGDITNSIKDFLIEFVHETKFYGFTDEDYSNILEMIKESGENILFRINPFFECIYKVFEGGDLDITDGEIILREDINDVIKSAKSPEEEIVMKQLNSLAQRDIGILKGIVVPLGAQATLSTLLVVATSMSSVFGLIGLVISAALAVGTMVYRKVFDDCREGCSRIYSSHNDEAKRCSINCRLKAYQLQLKKFETAKREVCSQQIPNPEKCKERFDKNIILTKKNIEKYQEKLRRY